ncbi:MAG: RidA family protein [Candidatus Kariarchaeaceae archaeon]|jgi:enamine deaminase RidA (YjgF/YER057c/UK114 family)
MSNKRKNISSGTIWENEVGYSRAVVVDKFVYVSGTTATSENGEIVGVGDAYAQTKQIIKNIEKALQQAGANLDHVVRTRMFVTDISLYREYGRAHAEFFKDIKPTTSMVEVSKLVSDDLLIEIEADAILW